MNKPANNLTRREQAALAYHRTEQWFGLARTAIRTAGWVAAVYFLQFTVEPLAGHETLVSLKLALLGDLKFAATITLAGATTAWAVVERILRQRKTEYFQGRIKELESKVDPGRTSSKLTPKGKTNPMDLT